jgi:hypothetical protein
MININMNICQFENCNNIGFYGLFYGDEVYCKTHKCNNHKLLSRLCKTIGCNKYPTHNYENVEGVLYCNYHKLDGMVSKDNRICKYDGCNIRSSYNYENESKPIYCVSHKLNGMVSKNNYKCYHENCRVRPSHNYENEPNPIYCHKHKLENMVNIVSKKCNYIGCKLIPSFNFKNEIGRRFCYNHKLEGMVCKDNRICEYDGCNIRASFNFENEITRRFCYNHKLEYMVCRDNRKCKSNLCFGSRGNIKYNGYCTYCFQNLFPDDPLTLQIHTKSKELKVRNYLFEEFEGFIHDEPIWSGNCDCTHRRRIDFRKLIGNTLLCIEVDENQHKGYNKTDEEIRYDDLYMLHSGKFIFIRFNPDKFKYNEKTLNPNINTRLLKLKYEIETQIQRIENDLNSDLLEITKLFYDS